MLLDKKEMLTLSDMIVSAHYMIKMSNSGFGMTQAIKYEERLEVLMKIQKLCEEEAKDEKDSLKELKDD